jgi:hypothetical protein
MQVEGESYAHDLARPCLAAAERARECRATSANQQIEALASPGAANCRDRIVAVRQERGLPPLEEGKAEPERPPAALDREPFHPGETEALLVYAVDREIDGCDVLVMAGNPEDVRPLPQLAEEDWRVRPAAQRNR